MGTISYGAYLWHYPVFIYLNADRTGLAASAPGLRFACTFALAALSYYLVERPVMYGTFWRSLKAITPSIALMVATVAVIVVGTLVPATAAVRANRFRGPISESKPPLVLVLGDSTAYTLGFALTATAPAGTTVVNGGLFGCGLVIGTSVSNAPPKPELAMFPDATRRPRSVPVAGRGLPGEFAVTAPGDVVLFLAGTWETQDILLNGRWMHIGSRRTNATSLPDRLAVAIGTMHGAHFDFATMPALAAELRNTQSPRTPKMPRRAA